MEPDKQFSSLEEPSDPDKSSAASARRYLRRITPASPAVTSHHEVHRS